MKNFIRQYQNAKVMIRQIRAGEWVPRYNSLVGEHLTAFRNGLELWIGSGPWFCEIEGGRYFGMLWRHYVWWAAARRMKRDADAAHYAAHCVVHDVEIAHATLEAWEVPLL